MLQTPKYNLKKPDAATDPVDIAVINGNMDLLDGALDTMQTTVSDTARAKHTHGNKGVLDGITAALIATWNTITSKADKAEVGEQLSQKADNNNIVLTGTSNLNGNEIAVTETAALVLLNGWTYGDNYPGYAPKICRVGNIVTVTGVISGGIVTSQTQICILHPRYVPSSSVYLALSLSDNNNSMSILIQTTGSVVIIRPPSPLDSYGNIHFNFSFCL